ncbi:MAG: carotenoid biosynthesis protein [Acidobacteriota bacterium]|nr:carotenoid biosynthesis protein [Acidobacteriota bacterium]
MSPRLPFILGIALWAAYAVLWIGGVGGHVLYGGTPANTAWAAPAFLLLAGLIVLTSSHSGWRALCAAGAIGFVSELIGVHFGVPFGRYQYTRALQPMFWHVPVVLLFAWMVLIAFVREMRVPVLIGAAWMTAIDSVIDPVASQPLAYWRWIEGGHYYGIPALNFIGWYLVSALILAVLPARGPRRMPASLAGITIILFFAILALAHRLYIPGAIGLALTAISCRLLWSAILEERRGISSSNPPAYPR